MGLFDKLHERKFIISETIDDYLMSLDYIQGKSTYSGYSMKKGFGWCRWYLDTNTSTHVCIYPDEIMFYQEYSNGIHCANNRVPIPKTFLLNLESFIAFLNKTFDDNESLFK